MHGAKRLSVLTAMICCAALLSGCQTAQPADETAAESSTADPPADSPFMFHEARTPEGWPEPTPVGQVQVKEYPACRVAVVEADQARQGDQDSMFMTLFKHIKANDIKMTAPVQMTYAADAGSEASEDEARPVAMAFLYFSQTQGTPGVDGAVEVRDVPARRVVSLGVRGDYTSKHLKQAVAQLRAYLDEHADQYTPTGPPRYLGYNSPFVPWFLKYGEVQIPIAVNQSP